MKTLWIEHKFSLAQLSPPGNMYGTADAVIYDDEARTLEVIDLKNGSGVVVQVKNNPQLKYYALGAALSLGKDKQIETVKITVVQPNAAHPDGVIRSEEIDYLDLLAFAGELMEAARLTLDDNAPLHPGAHCRFCPAAPICPAQREMVQDLAQVAFEAMPLDVPPAPETLPPAVFADILQKLPILEDWAKSMRAHALRQLEADPGSVPGYKLVKKRATRSWVSDTQVHQWLWEDKGYREEEMFKPRELKSPAQIEKLVGKANLPAEYVQQISSGYTLAPESDKRPALALDAASAFEALPSGE